MCSKYSYSNPAFIYLARVIEKLSGLSYQAYIQRHIFTSLGHTGSQAGFRAFLEFNPQTGLAVIAAFNTSHASDNGEAEKRVARASQNGFNALREQSFDLLR